MRISPLAESPHLSKVALAKLPAIPTPELTKLVYASQRGKFRFVYDRRWDLTSDDPTLAVMRMVDRGELIAQCNVSPLPPVSAGKQTSLSEFQADVQKSLGKNFGQFLNASEKPGHDNVRILRVVASGEVSQLTIQWIYYLVANEQGHQVSLAFTLEGNLTERFADADRKLVSSLRFAAPPETAPPTSETAAARSVKKKGADRTAAKAAKGNPPKK
jgi:hypothetical protein